MTYNPGDVIYAAFPYTDAATVRRRPVLVLSEADYNTQTGHIIGAMITTAANSKWPHDTAVKDLKAAGLNTPCFVRFKTFSLDTEHIIKPLGRLSDADFTRVCKSFKHVFKAFI